MSQMLYNPDPAAIPVGIPFTRQLSQRDLSLQVPINYVTTPGVTLTSACFARNRYEDVSAAKCFSNLLAVGFDRFVIDIYWDVSRHLWSLCPVELGENTAGSEPSTTSSASSTSSGAPNSAARTAAPRFHKLLEFGYFRRRQVSSSDLGALTPVLTTTTLNPGTASPTANASPSPSAGELVEIGPYACTSSINLPLLARVMHSHLDNTQFKQNATLKYFILNLHAAAPIADPTGSANAPASADLPDRSSVLSSIITSELSDFLYTPDDLRTERSNLNASSSWFGGDVDYTTIPESTYFRVEGSSDHSSTPNGWPSASFVEMIFAKRMLAGYGQVDPQMEGYNFAADSSVMFSPNYIQSKISVTTDGKGQVDSGCFYQPGTHALQKINSSWATSAKSVNIGDGAAPLKPLFTEAGNLTYCGISPLLNQTLNDMTADQDYKPYKTYVQKSIWSWLDGEPQNSTGKDDESNTKNRCAVLNSTSGFWQTENCAVSHYSACRNPHEIYKWAISQSSAAYINAQISCKDETQFTVPNTAVENTYLLHKWRATIASEDIDDELLWLNFNDLDAKSCWVIGQNETCPYLPAADNDRAVVVPVVAAIIVFVLAGLTVFVKCAANRQQSKRRRRRGDDGWDYEGVPS